ncbi:MAG: protein kinase [Thermoanaerobaculales bacterium]|jgi:serine/threonine protein kinase/Tol biopolymer transport system component|nr:protein kinase [Thermoanaerobaculales bacterium]
MLNPGVRIGHYRVAASIGAGGMGEVWRAEDTKLGRDVALKVLPTTVAEDAEKTARFEREAKVLASLNHPNIAHLYGLETIPICHPERVEGSGEGRSGVHRSPPSQPSGDPSTRSAESIAQGDTGETTFLVMELVDGEDLSERIARGPIPVDEAVPIALQIAAALEAAHEAGIVHRDLKPANIKLRPDGTVKVLDFGLAKAWETDGADASLSLSPTMTQHATAAGVILGTAAYMSPEQAAGTQADRRADIWAFGVVLWEMLTGHKLFDGETVSHVLASVLKDEVDLEELPEDIPPRIRELVGRCLVRDPRQRLQAIGDARIQLEEIERDPGALFPSQPSGGKRNVEAEMPRVVLPWVVAAVATALLLVSLWFAVRPTPDERTVLRAEISPPEETVFWLQAIAPGAAQVSPDGSKIVFAAVDSDGERLLWIRRIRDSVARPLPGTDGAAYPFWAPDSRRIGYFSFDGKLRKIDTSGGPPVTICTARNGKGGTWNDTDQILFAPTHDSPILLVSAGGGEPVPVTEMSPGITSHRLPTWLTDGRFLYLARSAGGPEGDRVMVGSINAGDQDRELIAAASNTSVVGDQLLFVREGTLMAQPFDRNSTKLVGDALPIAEDVLYIGGARYGAFSVSDNGLLIYNTGESETKSEIVWVDRSGELQSEFGDGHLLFDIEISPDGRFAAVTELESSVGTADIWVCDLERKLRTRFTFDPTNDWYPAWSPDGRMIVFASARNGSDGIWIKDVGGSGDARLLLESADKQLYPQSWSPDGEWVVYERVGTDNNTDLCAVRPEDGQTVELVVSKYDVGFGAVSPDGRWMAFVSNESGHDEVYVTTFPEPARRWQISTAGGSFPRWSRDGRELFFASAAGDLFVAEVSGEGETFDVGHVEELHSWHLATTFRRPFDVTPGSGDLLVIRGLTTQTREPLKVVLNWNAELESERR